VNILIDAQLPPGLKLLLTAAGHEARHVAEVALRDATDREIWDYAVRENMVIMTKDEDFAMRRIRESEGPTIIWLRIGNCSRAALARWLLPLLGSIEGLVEAGENLIEVR
jgi:predicted nuclease of predicted toxin-antitoxin system